MLAALIALVVGPRRTFSFLGQVIVVATIVMILVALIVVGFAVADR